MLIHIDRRVISETRICEVGSQISGSRYFSRINGRVLILEVKSIFSSIDHLLEKKKKRTKKVYLQVYLRISFFFFKCKYVFKCRELFHFLLVNNVRVHNNFHS